MSLFSAQMCTSPQNIYVPRAASPWAAGGPVWTKSALRWCGLPVRRRGTEAAASILATVQSSATLDLVGRMHDSGSRRARSCSTRAIRPPGLPGGAHRDTAAAGSHPTRDLYCEERFGPIGFVIETDDAPVRSNRPRRRACGRRHHRLRVLAAGRFPGHGRSGLCDGGAQLTCNSPARCRSISRPPTAITTSPAEWRWQRDADGRSLRRARFRIAQSRRPVA